MNNNQDEGMDQLVHFNQVEPEGNPRLALPGEFPLRLRRTFGVRPDGDGWEPVVDDTVWNGRQNPLVMTIRTRAPRKQGAARMVRKIESMDDRQIVLPMTDDGQLVDLGRNVAEVRPNTALQGVRGTNFDMGAKYAGGQKAVRDFRKQARAYSAPPKTRDKVDPRKAEIERLEMKISQILGLLK